MQSKFGLKDLVTLVLLVGIVISVFLSMVQEDRRWDRIREIDQRLKSQETALARIEREGEQASNPSRDAQREVLARLDQVAAGQRQPIEMLAAVSAQLEALRRSSGESDAKLQERIAEIQHQAEERSRELEARLVEGRGKPDAAARDESWARPGVPVSWQAPWGYVNDPGAKPGFRTGGEFTEVFEAQPAKVTPFIQTDVYGRRVVDLVMQSLGDYDPRTLKLRGVLAEAWQYDPNGLWLRARINPRARFSDGTPVTAEDVRWTFHDFIKNPEIEAERDRSIMDPIVKVEALSAEVVEFTFKEPFFSNMDLALTMFVLPKHFYGRFTPAELNQSTGLLMGSGPFKLGSLDPNRQWSPPAPVVLVRNEQYWGGSRPPLDVVRFKAINDELARLTEYKNGQADMVTPSSPQFVSAQQDAEWVKTNQNLNWVNMRSGRSGIIWNCGPRNGKLTPFSDVRVRVAMTHLLDRERMIKDIWKGIGVVANGFFNPGTMGYDPDLKPWPYDPVRARELLAQAGWKDRDGNRVLEDEKGNEFVFELTYFGGGEIAERIAKFVVDSCAAAGIRCTLRQMDWSVGEPVRSRRDFDAMLMGWGANAPESDPKQIFHSDSIQNQGDNFAQWSNADADRAIDQARRELDPVKREVLWRAFSRVMHQDQPYTWVRVAPFIRFVKPQIGNVNMYPRGLELWEFFRGVSASPTPGS
jgi:peptide/nickel transport system substrate-binding protein